MQAHEELGSLRAQIAANQEIIDGLNKHLARKTDEVRIIQQISFQITASLDLGEILASILKALDQVLGFFGTLGERSGGTFRATLHDVVANDEHAIGVHSSDAERDGRTVRSPTVLVFHVRDGRIAETWSHHYDQHEFDEFWS